MRSYNLYAAFGVLILLQMAPPYAFLSLFRASNINDELLYSDGHGNCMLPDELVREIRQQQDDVQHIVDSIVGEGARFAGDTWLDLSKFIELHGPRLTGSAALEKSIDYMVDVLRERGLENVHTEEAPVPHWERGYESAELVKPYAERLNILGLGGSVGTPRGGIIAQVVAVESFDEFDRLNQTEVSGKIVLFVPEWKGYGATVAYRSRAASVAAGKGAVAALVRSITPQSIGSPHTGGQRYADGVRRIPVACVTVEDATKMLTMHRRGIEVQVRLEMGARNFPDPVVSRNTVAELLGSKAPHNESVVVLAGHLDSWDVGNGAMDDAGGAFVAWKAIEFLNKLGLRSRRTIRAVLWTGEEQGYIGARQYRKDHLAGERKEFNFFMESDTGTFDPTGLALTGNADAECVLREIIKLMHSLNATELRTPSDGLSDVELWTDVGFPGASLETHNEHYMWYHHSAGDSMLVENPDSLDKCTALFAAVAYVVANLSEDIPRTYVDNLI